MQLVAEYEKEHGRSTALRRHYNQFLAAALQGGGGVSEEDVSAEYINGNATVQRLVNKALGNADAARVTPESLARLQQNPTIRSALRALRALDQGQPGWSQCRFMSMSEQWCNAAPQCQYTKRWWPRQNTCDQRQETRGGTGTPPDAEKHLPDRVAPRSSLTEKIASVGASLGVAALNPVLGALTAVGAVALFGRRNRKRLQRWQHRIEKHPFKAVMDMWNLSLMGRPGSFDTDGSWHWPPDPSKPAVLAGMAFASPDGTFGRPGLWIQNQEKRQELENLLRKVHEIVEGADLKALSNHIRYVQKGNSVYTLE